MGPWRSVSKPQAINVVAPDGTLRCTVIGYFSGAVFFIDDMRVDVHPGDEIRKIVGDGPEEIFRVDDILLYERGRSSFPPHYQVTVSRLAAP